MVQRRIPLGSCSGSNGTVFCDLPCSTKGKKQIVTKFRSYTGLLDNLLRQGLKNSFGVLGHLQQADFDGGVTHRKRIYCRLQTSYIGKAAGGYVGSSNSR